MKSEYHNFEPVTKTLEELENNYLKNKYEIAAVLNKYPDVESMWLKDENKVYSQYCSPLISKENDVLLNYLGYWDNLTIMPYLKIYDELGNKINIYHPIRIIYVMRSDYSHYENEPRILECFWNDADKLLLQLGFSHSIVKDLYNTFLYKLKEAEDKNAYRIKLNHNSLPSYIKNKLPFM